MHDLYYDDPLDGVYMYKNQDIRFCVEMLSPAGKTFHQVSLDEMMIFSIRDFPFLRAGNRTVYPFQALLVDASTYNKMTPRKGDLVEYTSGLFCIFDGLYGSSEIIRIVERNGKSFAWPKKRT